MYAEISPAIFNSPMRRSFTRGYCSITSSRLLRRSWDNRYMSWVTFTDPELASFGLNENQLIKRKIRFRKIEQDFNSDDRAVTDNYQYAKMILYISAPRWFKKQVILGGTMIAPHAGELIQELILANNKPLFRQGHLQQSLSLPGCLQNKSATDIQTSGRSINGYHKNITTKSL